MKAMRKTTTRPIPDGLTQYFNNVSNSPLLTPEEEYGLAQRFQQTGDRYAKEKLIRSNLRFVVKVAMDYKTYGFPLLDLVQEGNLGLIRAVESFDPEKGFRLISYGVWWIRSSIQEYILKNWSIVRIGTTQTQRKLFNNLVASSKHLKNLTEGASESQRRQAIADKTGTTVDQVSEMERRMFNRPLSLDAPLGATDDAGRTGHEHLRDDRPDAEDLVVRHLSSLNMSDRLLEAMATLPERDVEILRERYLGERSTTLRELGERFEISKERVRQIENRALTRLKAFLAHTEVPELLAV